MIAARRVAGKLGALLLTLFLASLLVFFSRFLVPGDPVSFLLRGRKPSPEAVAQVTAQYGLDLPAWQQYLQWLGGVLQGDFGRSLQYRQDVTTVIGERLPVTLGLVVMAGLMIAVVGLVGGIVAALNRGRVLDRAVLIGLTVLGAIPSFVGVDRAHRRVRGAARLVPVVRLGRGVPRHRLPPRAALDRARGRLRRARRQGDPFVDGRPARSRARRGGDQSRPRTPHGRAPSRLPQRDRADPHGQRPPRRRPPRRELDRRGGLRARRHRLAARAVGRPARLPRRAGDRAASSCSPSSS